MASVPYTSRRVPGVRWMRHYDLRGFPSGEHVGLPSSAISVVVPLDPPLDVSMPGAPRRQVDSCLAGMHDTPATIHHDGVQRGLQVAIAPLVLDRLFGVPAGAVAGEAVEFAELMGDRPARRLLDRIVSAPTWPARLALLESEMLRRFAVSTIRPLPRPEVVHAWSLLAESGGTAFIGEVAAAVGWSPRHLAQQFAAAVGTTPKAAARIMRFERSVRLIRAGHDLAGVAARCRYADQAHMTREWRLLAGTTPARWTRDDVLANVQDRRHRPGR